MKKSYQNLNLHPHKNKNGFILIFTLGIMSIIFILGIALAVNVKIDEKISLNLKRSMIAEEYARMGISHAINVIEAVYADSDVFSLPQDSISNHTLTNGGYDVTIRDCNSKINLNYCGGINTQAYEELTDIGTYTTTSNFLKPVLDVLVDKLGVTGLDTQAAADFVPNFKAKEDLLLFFPGLTSDQKVTEFSKIKDYITVHGYVNSYVEGRWGALDPRAPVNINASYDYSDTVVYALIHIMIDYPVDNAAWAEDMREDKRQIVINDLNAAKPITSWRQYDDVIDNLVYTDDLFFDFKIKNASESFEKKILKENFNPNIPGSDVNYRIYEKYYDPDDDSLTAYKVEKGFYRLRPEFIFHPGGYYEIESTGQLTSGAGELISSRTINTVVQIADVWHQTREEEFRGEDENYNGIIDGSEEDVNLSGTADIAFTKKTTYISNLPTESTDDEGLNYKNNFQVKSGSIKIGYWDDFENSDYTFSNLSKGYDDTGVLDSDNDYVVLDEDNDGDSELVPKNDSGGVGNVYWPNTQFKDLNKWDFYNYSLRIEDRDDSEEYKEYAFRHSGWIILRQDPLVLNQNNSVSEVHGGVVEWNTNSVFFYSFDDTSVVEWDNWSGTVNSISIADTPSSPDPGDYIPGDFYPQLVSLPHPEPDPRESVSENPLVMKNSDPANNTGSDPDWGWSTDKTYHIVINGSDLDNTVHNANGEIYNVSRSDALEPTAPVNIRLYGDKMYAIWDNLRIIPDKGQFRSVVHALEEPVTPAHVFFTVSYPRSLSDTSLVNVDIRVGVSDNVTVDSVGYMMGVDWSDTILNDGYGKIGRWDAGDTVWMNQGAYLQYEADLYSYFDAVDNPYKETPILEDISIIYLLPTYQVKSWRIESD